MRVRERERERGHFEEFRVYVTDTCGSGGLPTILGGLGSSPTIIILGNYLTT